MKRNISIAILLVALFVTFSAQAQKAHNPIIFADVPDVAMIRVGDTYYMASTTMHMNPGIPVMKSKDLVNWEIINYAYDTLGEIVYITNPTSPQSTWANMISDIKGEHYRVGNDEWNFLAAKFNISGIPHYVLVIKNRKW